MSSTNENKPSNNENLSSTNGNMSSNSKNGNMSADNENLSSTNGNMSSDNENRHSDKEIVITSWKLKHPDAHGEAKDRIKLQYANNAPEAIFEDARKLVHPVDIQPGGKYRSKSHYTS